MATPMSRLLEEVSRDHFHPPVTPEEIEAFEQRVGWTLDPDLRAFYLHCNGVFPVAFASLGLGVDDAR
jgi:hypothetical protein